MSEIREVIDYLKKHPSFFKEHEDLMVELGLEFAQNTPFYARQLKVLKDRESQQQSKIDLIIDSAKNNQRLTSDLLALAIRLLGERQNGVDPRAAVVALVKRQFNLRGVVVLLDNQDAHARHPQYDQVRQRVVHKSSVCDDRVSSTLRAALYGPKYQAIKSCAFVPLVYAEKINGLMVLGADRAERFQPGVGVMFLDQLGLLLGGFFQGVK